MPRITLANGQHHETDARLAAGKTGEVYTLAGAPDRIAKLYRDDATLPDTVVRLKAVLGPLRGVAEALPESLMAWPEAFVTEPRLGVLMRRVPERFVPLGRCLALAFYTRRLAPEQKRYRARVRAALELARGVQALHERGLAHGDLSPNNALVDPTTGEVRLIDLDGVAVPGFLRATVLGTPRYIAPELLDDADATIGARRPAGGTSTIRDLGGEPWLLTDLHALAVLVHQLVLFVHPFEGRHVFDADPLRDEALRFGRAARWCLDPADESNRPRDHERPHKQPAPLDCCGAPLNDLFRRALVAGVARPGRRPPASAWVAALGELSGALAPCAGGCDEQTFPVLGESPSNCPWCETPVPPESSRAWRRAWLVQALPAPAVALAAADGDADDAAHADCELAPPWRQVALRPIVLTPGLPIDGDGDGIGIGDGVRCADAELPSSSSASGRRLVRRRRDGTWWLQASRHAQKPDVAEVVIVCDDKPSERAQLPLPLPPGGTVFFNADPWSRGLRLDPLPPPAATIAGQVLPELVFDISPAPAPGSIPARLHPGPGQRGVVLELDRFERDRTTHAFSHRSQGHPAGRVYWRASAGGWVLRLYPCDPARALSAEGAPLPRSGVLRLASGVELQLGRFAISIRFELPASAHA